MSIFILEAKLERQESTTPWGFRMQGGKDFSSPITIARVTPGSLAAKCGLQQGDVILKIGSKASEVLKHKDAQDAIVSYGNKLCFLLQRIREKKKTISGVGGGSQNAQTYDMFSTPTIGSQQGQSGPSPVTQNYNTAPKPFGSAPSKPAPYSVPQIDVVSQQTQNLNPKGGTQNTQAYDQFSTPTIGSYQSPASPSPATQSYNTAPQPFGSAPSKPAPYAVPQIDVVSKQSQNVNPNPSSYSKYAHVEDETGPISHQSRSFKYLQYALDSGQDIPTILRPTVNLRRSPSPNAGVKTQFNSPIGLYSGASVQKQQGLVTSTQVTSEGTNGNEEESTKFDAQGKLLYRPSETFKLVHELENASQPQDNYLGS